MKEGSAFAPAEVVALAIPAKIGKHLMEEEMEAVSWVISTGISLEIRQGGITR